MYDVTKLKTVEECRTVMERAKARGMDDIYTEVFERSCALAGQLHDDPSDPMVRDFHEVLAAYEQLLTEKNGKTTKASRTRQKLSRTSVHQCLLDWALAPMPTEGFKLLVQNKTPQFTAEHLVIKYADRFPPNAVERAKKRLAGIA